jgi:hypothetical protein
LDIPIECTDCGGNLENRTKNSNIKQDIYFYPNPAKTNLNFFNKNKSEFKIELLTVEGENIVSKSIPPGLSEIDISSILSGIYFIKQYNSDNDIKYHKLIIIK